MYSHRNRFMIERSQRVLAVYDGRQSGGTYSTILTALKFGRELHTISACGPAGGNPRTPPPCGRQSANAAARGEPR